MATVLTKKVDKKGRILIPELANSMVLIERVAEGEFLLKAAEVIPTKEVWFHKNKIAKALVEKGLTQAAAGKFVRDPRSEEDLSWVAELEDVNV